MNLNKISSFIRLKRKELGITQEELAQRLFVTEKAISRWETGRGTPDISLLIPLSKELNVDVSELLNGEESVKANNGVEQLIEYNEMVRSSKYSFRFKLIIFFYILSIFSFLFYLRFEYDPSIEVNYFIRLIIIVIASLFVVIGNKLYSDNFIERIEDKKKVLRFSNVIVFVYYIVFLFNMVVFARYGSVDSYNLIPFKSIIDIFRYQSIYSIIINIFGNLVIFMPLDYFLIELFGLKNFLNNFFVSFFIILLIELLQYVFKVGVFDVDDLTLCTFGMMIFYFIYIRVRKNNL